VFSVCGKMKLSEPTDVFLISFSYSRCSARAMYKLTPDWVKEKYVVNFIANDVYYPQIADSLYEKLQKYCYDASMIRNAKIVASTHGFVELSRKYIELWHGLPIKK